MILITDYVSISKKDFESQSTIDLGIGVLDICFEPYCNSPEFTYTFTPSEAFLNKMKTLYDNNFQSDLNKIIKNRIDNRLTSVYKGLLK